MTRTFNKLNGAVAAIAAAAMLAVVAFVVGVQPAFADDALQLQNKNGEVAQVSDAVTKFDVVKQDPDTQEQVKGAVLQIYAKDNPGVILDQWTTDGTTHHNSKQLDVNVHYILHEVSAPDGYATAADVEFYIDEIEGVGIHIVSGGSDQGGNAELKTASEVHLYDKKLDSSNQVTVTKSSAPKTGDMVMWIVVGAVAVCVVAGVVLFVARKRSK